MPPLPEDGAPADPATPPADPAQNPNPADPAGAPKQYDEAHVKALRQEAADNRKKLAAAEARLKELDDAKLGETERLKKQADEATAKATAAETRARTSLSKASVLMEAQKANLVDPDLAFTLLKDAVEFDDEGNPTNAAALVAKLAKEKPFLVSTGTGGGSSNANPQAPRGGNGGGQPAPGRMPRWSDVFKRG